MLLKKTSKIQVLGTIWSYLVTKFTMPIQINRYIAVIYGLNFFDNI